MTSGTIPNYTAESSEIHRLSVFSEPVPNLPPNQKLHTLRWLYTIKLPTDETVERYKARIVVRGFLQEYNKHYFETYASCMRKETLRLLLFLRAQGWSLVEVDVKNAFCYGETDAEIWVLYPEGFPGYREDLRQYARLLKSLYGTKQAQRMFEEFVKKVLKRLNYKPSQSDPSLYIYINPTSGIMSIIGVFVDNMMVASLDPTEYKRIMEQSTDTWVTTVKTTVTKILGLKVIETSHGVLLYDDNYFLEVATELNLLDKILKKYTPGPANSVLLPNTQYKAPNHLVKLYDQIVGSLLWGANNWRPDSTYEVTQLSRFLANPSYEHMDAAIDCLSYLITTKERGLLYTKNPYFGVSNKLQGITFTDANWSRDSDAVSTSGHLMHICTPQEKVLITSSRPGTKPAFPLHNVISWFSRKQRNFIAISTEASETMAASVSTRQIEWTRGLFAELGFTDEPQPTPGSKPLSAEEILDKEEIETPWLLLIDNSATVANLNSGKIPKDNHQNARLFAYVKNATGNLKQVKPWKVNTLYNTADILTKLLVFPVHDGHCRSITSTLTFISTGTEPVTKMSQSNKRQKV